MPVENVGYFECQCDRRVELAGLYGDDCLARNFHQIGQLLLCETMLTAQLRQLIFHMIAPS